MTYLEKGAGRLGGRSAQSAGFSWLRVDDRSVMCRLHQVNPMLTISPVHVAFSRVGHNLIVRSPKTPAPLTRLVLINMEPHWVLLSRAKTIVENGKCLLAAIITMARGGGWTRPPTAWKTQGTGFKKCHWRKLMGRWRRKSPPFPQCQPC